MSKSVHSRSLHVLTQALDAVVASYDDPSVVAERVGLVLRSALADQQLLDDRHREPWPDRYRPHLVHVHPEGLYSIVALVWKPEQRTPIHDHLSWCVVGVWQGVEQETSYELRGDHEEPFLVARKSTISLPGSVSVLVPPDEDIHAVGNYGRELAISVHVYGADIGVLGSSVNRTFPDDLVRQDDWSGSPVSWRALEHDLARAG